MTPDKYFFQPVLWGFEHGLISTAEDGKFHADNTLTRAQAITFMYRAVDGEDYDLEQTFSDVKPGDWYYDAANWAYGAGVVGRNDNFTFEGNAQITRAQFVTFMHRAFVPEASLWNQAGGTSAQAAASTASGGMFTLKGSYSGNTKTVTLTAKGLQDAKETGVSEASNGDTVQKASSKLKRGQDAEFSTDQKPSGLLFYFYNNKDRIGVVKSSDSGFQLADRSHFTYSEIYKASMPLLGDEIDSANMVIIVWAYSGLEILVSIMLTN